MNMFLIGFFNHHCRRLETTTITFSLHHGLMKSIDINAFTHPNKDNNSSSSHMKEMNCCHLRDDDDLSLSSEMKMNVFVSYEDESSSSFGDETMFSSATFTDHWWPGMEWCQEASMEGDIAWTSPSPTTDNNVYKNPKGKISIFQTLDETIIRYLNWEEKMW